MICRCRVRAAEGCLLAWALFAAGCGQTDPGLKPEAGQACDKNAMILL